jgi:DNA-binding SARP family transcriptional activator
MSNAFPTEQPYSLESAQALISLAQEKRYSDTLGAILAAEQAFTAAQDLNDTPLLLDSLKQLSVCSSLVNDYAKAVAYAELLLREAQPANSLERQADAHTLIGIAHHDMGNLDNALEQFQKALSLHDTIGATANAASVLYNIGNIYAFKGWFETALEWHLRCLELKPVLPRTLVIQLLNGLGCDYHGLGNYADALRCLIESEQLAEADCAKVLQGAALGNLVSVYLDYGDVASALPLSVKALSLAEELKNDRQIAAKKLQLGTIYAAMGDSAAAIAQFLDALTTAERIGAMFLQTDSLTKLGDIYAQLGDADRAKQHFLQARQLAKEFGYHFLEGQATLALAKFFMRQNHFDDALDMLRSGIEISQQCGAKALEQEYHAALASTYKSLGDFSKSARHAKLSERLNQQTAVNDNARKLLIEFEAQRFLKKHAHHNTADFETALQLARKAIEQKHLRLTPRQPPSLSPAVLSLPKDTVLVKTFGEFVVTINGRTLSKDDWQRKKARDIFKILLINHRNAVTTDELIELLWNGNLEKNVEQVIKNSASFIRKALEPDLLPRERSQFLRTEGKAYILDLGDEDSIDFLCFKKLIRQAATDRAQRTALYEQAVLLYTGDFLKEDLYADWATLERESLKDSYLNALVALADAASKAGNDDVAIARAKQLLDADRTHDKGYEILLKTLCKRGDLPEARRIYAQCQDAFKKELDSPPPPYLQRLFPKPT